MKKQATLFKFGTTKNFEHHGEKVQVSGSSFAKKSNFLSNIIKN